LAVDREVVVVVVAVVVVVVVAVASAAPAAVVAVASGVARWCFWAGVGSGGLSLSGHL